MQSNPTTTRIAPMVQKPAPAPKSDAAQKLEHARQRVRFALRAAEEGPLTVSTADDIARCLTVVMRDLEELTLQVAVMARKAQG